MYVSPSLSSEKWCDVKEKSVNIFQHLSPTSLVRLSYNIRHAVSIAKPHLCHSYSISVEDSCLYEDVCHNNRRLSNISKFQFLPQRRWMPQPNTSVRSRIHFLAPVGLRAIHGIPATDNGRLARRSFPIEFASETKLELRT